jgi:hypothetical protein
MSPVLIVAGASDDDATARPSLGRVPRSAAPGTDCVRTTSATGIVCVTAIGAAWPPASSLLFADLTDVDVSRLCRPTAGRARSEAKVAGPLASCATPAAAPDTPRPASNSTSDVCPVTATGNWVVGSPSPPDDETVSVGTGRFSPGMAAAPVGCAWSGDMIGITACCSEPGTSGVGTPSMEAASECPVDSACPPAVLRPGECLPVAVVATDGDTAPRQAACCAPGGVPAPADESRSGCGTRPDGMA